jgi:ribosomal protein L34E
VIDYNLVCDRCGRTIDGSTKSPADVRRVTKREGTATRHKGQDVCCHCITDEAAQALQTR